MSDVIDKLLAEAPNLAALCFVVYLFIAHSNRRDEMLKSMHLDHLDARKESRDAIRENTHAAERNTEAIIRLSDRLKGND